MRTEIEYEQNIATKAKRILVLVITGLFIVTGLAGCQQEGPAETAGKKLDRSIEDAEKKIEQTTEQAERKFDDAKKSISDKSETTDQYIDDAIITMHVKKAILSDALLKLFQIKVTTVNGVVHLSGTLDSQQSIDRAIEVATNQEHVRSVQNDLILDVNASSKQ
ncbi:BON domain-containing protein [Nitrosomonas oligotropha]|uniref:BON domain-containing protein n=1 Tax=Nitrosomonas oligotropha TaxID=42354 RepID=UPI001371F10B|nr:BON domain-containing protein [Nitrosomonas oligotropha]MXS82124.1 BON domain-containing protein [Nitrosomonas oligotropha]